LTKHSEIKATRAGGNLGDYLLFKVSDTKLALIQYSAESHLFKLEESEKAEDWGIFTSAFVFITFFSVFMYIVTSKNT